MLTVATPALAPFSFRAPRVRVPLSVWLMCAVAASATLAPVWNAEGWPNNHDAWTFAQRTHIYARHLAALDLLPLWTSVDNGGFGSPFPLFYHRVFYLVAGPLALITGSNKLADALTIMLMLMVGGAGTFRLTRELGGGMLAGTFGGISLIAANYTLTDWLVRGAVAELSGAMIIPWVLSGFVRSLRDRVIRMELGVSMGLLWHAHSVMAFYLGLLLAVTAVVLLALRETSPALLDPRTAWPALGVFVLCVGPHLAVMSLFSHNYDVSRILSWPFTPAFQFQEPLWYLWDTHWVPGHTRAGLTVQLDLAILALLALSVAAGLKRRELTRSLLLSQMPVVIPVLLCGALQAGWSAPFYEFVPGAAYIQFPWRLLGVITPSLIALAASMADRLLPPDKRLLAVGACAGWMMAGSQAFVPLADGRVTVDPASMTAVSFSGFREYEPISAPPRAELQAAIEARWRDLGCEVVRDGPDEETARVRFQVTCQRASAVPLPLYASAFHRVQVSGFERSEPCGALADVPTVCVATVPTGSHVIEVQMPSLGVVLRSAFSASASR